MGSSTATLSPVTAVPIADLTVSPLNPRREKKLDAVPLEELAASIRARGILQPLVARRVGGKLEVIAGRRRLEAARLAGLTEVPVIIRTLDDQEAASAALVENEQRTALRPLDGALAVAKRLEAGESVEAIAAAVGKSPSWVARRANLTKLAPAVRKALEDPAHEIRGYPLPVIELLALLPQEQQEERLEDTRYGDPLTVEDLKRELAYECAELARAPWKLDDALLVPKAGACDRCPNNSANSPNLFGDLELDGEKVAGAVCRNRECWGEKLQAFAADRVKVAAEEHGKELLRIVAPIGDGRNSTSSQKGALYQHQYQRVKAGAKGAKPAVIVSGEGIGEVVHVKVRDGAAPSPARPAPKPKAEPGTKAAVKASTERIERRRMAWRVDQALEELAAIKPPAADVMVKLAAVFGTGAFGSGSGSPGREAKVEKLQKAFAAVGTTDLWAAVVTEHHGLKDQLELRRQQDLDGAHDVVRWLTEELRGAPAWKKLVEASAVEVPAPKSLGGLKQTPAKDSPAKGKAKKAPAKRGRKA